MAALDTPFMSALNPNSAPGPSSPTATTGTTNTPVYAAFSPASANTAAQHRRTTLLVHQKSPILVATPPQITRALAYSHPFISPLSKFVGLLSWSTNDPWESFLLVAVFWATVLYGDTLLRTTGPLLFGAFLIFGMYCRRFSPLSSIGWSTPQHKTGEKRPRKDMQSASHHKSLDEIVASLQTLTTRCNILLDPLLDLTDFLSTQHTATTATTRPALTALFTRLLFVAPIWWTLTLPPLRLITTKRIVLTAGTLFLSWHSRPACVSRVILWRSKSVRRAAALITGLNFDLPTTTSTLSNTSNADKTAAAAAAKAGRTGKKEGIRFTFALYENQRRWLGIGWTHSMLAYERTPWTDEYLNPTPAKEDFELPKVQGGLAKWRWVEGSHWRVEDDSTHPEREAEKRKRAVSSGAKSTASSSKTVGSEPEPDADEEEGWIYYDNKWSNGRRGVDGWGRYTRRRKWVRAAVLVEVTPSMEVTPTASPRLSAEITDGVEDDRMALPQLDADGALLTPDRARREPNLVALPTERGHTRAADSVDSAHSAHTTPSAHTNTNTHSTPSSPTKEHRSWFRRRRRDKSQSRDSSQAPTPSTTGAASVTSVTSENDDDAASVASMTTRGESEDGGYVPMRQDWGRGWGVGDDVGMGLG